MSAFTSLVLAAGKGTRMNSSLPKVLHQACGASLLSHVLHAAAAAGAERQLVVLGAGRDQVERELASLALASRVETVVQEEQKGTGHAALMALPALPEDSGLVLILNGDGPLLRPESIAALVEAHRRERHELTLGVMELADPHGYGRVVLAGKKLRAVVEEKEASAAQRKIRLVNGGLYCVSRALLARALPKLRPSGRTGEIYLTDIVSFAAKAGRRMGVCRIPAEELQGVNDPAQLASAAALLRRRRIEEWLRGGVEIEAPEAFWFDWSVRCERGAKIGPNVVLRGKTRIGAGAELGPGCVVSDSELEEGVRLAPYSVLEESVVRVRAQVGPFARLRPGTEIGEEARVGNFVELKKSRLGPGSKANHLSYIGDAEIGRDVNVGCGFIACNYDGVNKHRTRIDDGAFVGSGVSAVAPVRIGKSAYVATGTVVNRDVPDGALAIARPKQENKEGYAERLRGRMRAAGAKKGS